MGVALELDTPLMMGTVWYLRGVVGVALADWSTVGVLTVDWTGMSSRHEVGVLFTGMGVSLVTSRSEVGVFFTGMGVSSRPEVGVPFSVVGVSLVDVPVNCRSTEMGVSLVPRLSNAEVE